MSKRKMRFFAFLLILAALLPSCTEHQPGSPQETAQSTESEEIKAPREILLTDSGRATLTIVYPENCGTSVLNAVRALQNTLEKLTGVTFQSTDDYTRNGQIIESSGEIIVGNCRRTEVQDRLKTLRYRDFAVCATEKNILIAGWEEEETLKALRYFSAQLTAETVKKQDRKAVLTWKEDHTEQTARYKYPDASVGDIPLSQYTIVYPAGDTSGYAEKVRSSIGTFCGYMLPVVPDSEPMRDHEILVGKTDRAESRSFYTGGNALDLMEYANTVRNGKIVIAGAGAFSEERALELFEIHFNACEGKLGSMNYERESLLKNIPPRAAQDAYRFMQYNILVEYPGWGSGGMIRPEVEYRKEPIAALLLEYRPDAACLNEVFETWAGQLPEMIGEVYDTVCLMRTDGSSNRNPIVYNKLKFELIDSGYEDIAVVQSINFRTVTWAVLKDRENGKMFAVFGTHWEVTSAQDREKQIPLMNAVIGKVAGKYPVPTIVMGDFNCRGNSGEFRKFLSTSGMNDAFGDLSAGRIDHIVVKKCDVLACGVEEDNYTAYASDHKPIWCDVRIGSN